MISKNITVPCIVTKDEIIPIWDERLEFINSNPEYIRFNHQNYYYITECLYNLEKKILQPFIVIDYFPGLETSQFKVGQEVYYEKSKHFKTIFKSTIKEIEYALDSFEIKKGKKLNNFYTKSLSIIPDSMYKLNIHKFVYILENEERIEYSYQIYKNGDKQII